jgi:hypothetical protein
VFIAISATVRRAQHREKAAETSTIKAFLRPPRESSNCDSHLNSDCVAIADLSTKGQPLPQTHAAFERHVVSVSCRRAVFSFAAAGSRGA